MSNKIFVGGLSYETSEKTLLEELEKHGKVISIRIVTDRDTGRSKGFGFATFESSESAKLAMETLDNSMFDGRRIGVKESIERNK